MNRRRLTVAIASIALALALAATLHAEPDPARSASTASAIGPAPGAQGGTPPVCAEVCSTAVRALGECDLNGGGTSPASLDAIGEQARVAQLDCAAYCARTSPAEVARVDACFPRELCADYRACLASATAVDPVAPIGTKRRDADGAEMVLVPAGRFFRGVPRAAKALHDLAREPVILGAFYVDRNEVTVAQYHACFAASACPGPAVDGNRDPGSVAADSDDSEAILRGCNWGVPGRSQHPINCVDYAAAKAYCRFVGARLPTETEWEKAARGDDARRYPWGIWDRGCSRLAWDPGNSVKTRGCSAQTTSEVGRNPAGDSPYGAHDLAGNVWEWVGGRFSEVRYADPKEDDGPGPREGYGVVRGGGWGQDAGDSLSHDTTTRLRWLKTHRIEGVGFRCATEGT